MSYLETKRNALMNAIASGKIPNLISNDLTWNRGYFNTSGGIVSTSSSTKDMYESEYIDVDTSETYLYMIYSPNFQSTIWSGIAQYQNDETFVNRWINENKTTLINQITYVFKTVFTQPKIRISLSTYGEAQIGLYRWSDILNYLGDKAEVIWE